MTVIDSHQHFWSLENNFANWPTSDQAPIHRDFGPQDLVPLLETAGVDGTILVQAAPALAETHYMLDLARHAPFVRGVVGWIDFAASDALAQLDEIAATPLLKGVRPMVQGIDDPEWLLQPGFVPIFEALIARGLCFDALIRRDQIGQVTSLGQRFPELRIVVDHAAKPAIAANEIDRWALDLTAAAQLPSIHCKLSGLWTEAGNDISPQRIAPFAHHVIRCFSPSRVMWGSDWPVLELAGSYGTWLDQARALTTDFSAQDRQAIFGGTARQFYNVN